MNRVGSCGVKHRAANQARVHASDTFSILRPGVLLAFLELDYTGSTAQSGSWCPFRLLPAFPTGTQAVNCERSQSSVLILQRMPQANLLSRLSLQPIELLTAVLGQSRWVRTAVFCASFAAMLLLPYIASQRRSKLDASITIWTKTIFEHPCVLIEYLHDRAHNIRSPSNALG